MKPFPILLGAAAALALASPAMAGTNDWPALVKNGWPKGTAVRWTCEVTLFTSADGGVPAVRGRLTFDIPKKGSFHGRSYPNPLTLKDIAETALGVPEVHDPYHLGLPPRFPGEMTISEENCHRVAP
jgi:hypothetical protein